MSDLIAWQAITILLAAGGLVLVAIKIWENGRK